MTDTVNVPREAWGEYKRSQIAHLRPYIVGETLSERVSISMADLEAGSPKDGDMIARNPANHDDQWLVAADYFAANFEPAASEAPKVEQEPVICHHEAYQGSCAHCGVKIVNGFAVRHKAHPAPSSELLAVAEAALEWIDALPESVVTDHMPMPGLDRDWADDVIAKHKGPQS